jgi:DNA-binding XRE family transcriptional regulator
MVSGNDKGLSSPIIVRLVSQIFVCVFMVNNTMKKTISPQNQLRLESIASYLRELRINEGITQKEVDCGIHPNSISNIENGKPCSIVSIFLLCDHYSIKISELFDML